MFGEDPAFEILSRREAKKGMRGSGEAVSAAMFAPTIGIYRTIKSKVW
jgi:hypothetical protein